MPFKRFPFAWNNPFGYLIAVTVEYTTCACEYFLGACTLALAIGTFWIAISMTKEIQQILLIINDEAKEKKIQSEQLNVLFSEFIDAHGIVKQLSIKFNVIKNVGNRC